MKKPPSIVYGVDDSPPAHVAALNAVQHVGLIAINLIYPILILAAVGSPMAVVVDVVAIGMFVLAAGTVMQALRGPIGSGYLCPSTFTATYLGPSLLAAKAGGLPLIFGMTAFAGLVETILAPALNRMRAIFPPEISGLVIFMIGWSASLAGLRLIFGGNAQPVSPEEWSVIGLTLLTMIALNVWGKGLARMLCALVGLAVGYAASAVLGVFASRAASLGEVPWFGLPGISHVGWAFDATLIAPFAIAAVAAAMKALGTVTVCQRSNDADWVRPDMRNGQRGVLADGASTILAGMAGAVGTNTSTPSAGLAAATGVTSRKVAYFVAAGFVMLGVMPKFAAWLALMPRAVMVSALLFAMSAVIINGIQIMSSRLLDARRTLVIALSIVAGTAVDVFPSVAASLPPGLRPIVGSALVLSTVVALSLNLLFRVGVSRTATMAVPAGRVDPEAVEKFFKASGANWGARPEVINRAMFGVVQLLDVVRGDFADTSVITLSATFDEFNLDVRVSYHGAVIEFPDKRPSNRELREGEHGTRLMAGFLLKRSADRLRSQEKNGLVTVDMHFDH